MLNKFSSIGLPANNKDEFENYFNKVYQNGVRIKVGRGTYIKWVIGGGIELWGQVNNNNEIMCVTPHFKGDSIIDVSLKRVIKREFTSELDGGFYACTDNLNGVCIPLIFDAPDMGRYGKVNLPKRVAIQVSAFAENIENIDSDNEFFIPSGILKFNNKKISTPEADVLLGGHIVETRKYVNPFTMLEYYWAKITVLGNELDVVISPDLLKGELTRGSILSGKFWLSGRVMKIL